MKKKIFGLGILAMVLVFGLAVLGCDNDPNGGGPRWGEVEVDDLDGTWDNNTINFTYEDTPVTLTRIGTGDTIAGVWEGTFQGNAVRVTVSDNNNWSMTMQGRDFARGTVSVSGTSITVTVTHVMTEGGNGDSNVQQPPPPDATGTWDFYIDGHNASVIITGNTWSFLAPDPFYNDNGTFTQECYWQAILFSNTWKEVIGMAQLLDNTTMILDLHYPSLIEGRFNGTRRQ